MRLRSLQTPHIFVLRTESLTSSGEFRPCGKAFPCLIQKYTNFASVLFPILQYFATKLGTTNFKIIVLAV